MAKHLHKKAHEAGVGEKAIRTPGELISELANEPEVREWKSF